MKRFILLTVLTCSFIFLIFVLFTIMACFSSVANATEVNAYHAGPIKGLDGYFHIAWVWREAPDAAANRDVSYARSRDLIKWEGADGRPIPLPISMKSGDIIDPIPINMQ